MQRPAAAKSHQSEVARIVAALDRDHANRLLHLRLNHTQNAGGKFLDGRERALCSCMIRSVRSRSSRTPPPRKLSASSRPSNRFASVTVGIVAAAKADRPRLRARRLRPDAQHAAGIESRDRSPAGAGGVNVQHRHTNRHAGNDDSRVRCAPPAVESARKHRSRSRPYRNQ